MKAIPLHVAVAAAFFALAGSAALPGPAGAQDYRSKQGAVPCDCTNCSAEHCPKPPSGPKDPSFGPLIGFSIDFYNAPAKGTLRSNKAPAPKAPKGMKGPGSFGGYVPSAGGN